MNDNLYAWPCWGYTPAGRQAGRTAWENFLFRQLTRNEEARKRDLRLLAKAFLQSNRKEKMREQKIVGHKTCTHFMHMCMGVARLHQPILPSI
mmetsp:Transcript_12813/g.25032  ORF Transcript_12813/g.25032 Transcript_12813/m.25032 type:complete len:93 (-) Transcript_12813:1054-1332(-)